MKMIKIMKRAYLLPLIIAIMAICSCTKVEVLEVTGGVIAEKEVPETAGEFFLPVTIPGAEKLVWRARAVSDWLHVMDSDWKQNSYNVSIAYDSNESTIYTRNFARVGHLVVESYDGFTVDTVLVKQRGITPFMKLEDTVVEASQTECEITFDSNLIDECRSGLRLSASESWVESIEYLSCGTHLLVKFAANGAAERQATIEVVFTDACGKSTNANCVLTQKAFVE